MRDAERLAAMAISRVADAMIKAESAAGLHGEVGRQGVPVPDVVECLGQAFAL